MSLFRETTKGMKLWVVSYIWNGKTYSENYSIQAEAVEVIYRLRRQGLDATLHYKEFK